MGLPVHTVDIASGTTPVTKSDRLALGMLTAVATPLAQAVAGAGTITFASQPADTSTITLNGTAVEFVAGTPTAGQVQIGTDLAHTLAALLVVLQASADTELVLFTYSVDATKLYLTAATAGVAGNSLTLAASTSPASHGTVSAGTLANGYDAGTAGKPATVAVTGLSLPASYNVQATPNQDAVCNVSGKVSSGFTLTLNPRLAANALATGTVDLLITH